MTEWRKRNLAREKAPFLVPETTKMAAKPRHIIIVILFVSAWATLVFWFGNRFGKGPGQGLKQKWDMFRHRFAGGWTGRPCRGDASGGSDVPSGAQLQALLRALLDGAGLNRTTVYFKINQLTSDEIRQLVRNGGLSAGAMEVRVSGDIIGPLLLPSLERGRPEVPPLK